MPKLSLSIAATILSLAISAQVSALETTTVETNEQSTSVSRTAAKRSAPHSNELRRVAMAPIKTQADLEAYLRLTPMRRSPFNRLAPAPRKEFIESLSFNENGLTGYKYRVLEEELTPTESYRILALFGSQADVRLFKRARIKTLADKKLIAPQEFGESDEFGDQWFDLPEKNYEKYRCVFRKTCEENDAYICKSSTC